MVSVISMVSRTITEFDDTDLSIDEMRKIQSDFFENGWPRLEIVVGNEHFIWNTENIESISILEDE